MKNTVATAMQVILMGAGFSLPSSNAQTQKEGTPYTIEYHEVSVNNSTGKVMEFRRTRAQRSDGSTLSATWNRFPGDERSYAEKVIRLVQQRKTVYVHEQVEAISTLYWSPVLPAPRFEMTKPASDLKPPDGETMLGFEVVKTSSQVGKRSMTQWTAPALGNTVLREVVEWRDESGNVISKNEKTALSVALEEPLASLFEVPSHYVEMPPSAAAEKTQLKYFNRPLGQEMAASMDRDYNRALRFRPQ